MRMGETRGGMGEGGREGKDGGKWSNGRFKEERKKGFRNILLPRKGTVVFVWTHI